MRWMQELFKIDQDQEMAPRYSMGVQRFPDHYKPDLFFRKHVRTVGIGTFCPMHRPLGTYVRKLTGRVDRDMDRLE